MTPEIHAWAARHGISHQAMYELRSIFALEGSLTPVTMPAETQSEAGVQSYVRHAAAKAGILAWRNNVGAMEDVDGRVVRFGLANDSAKMNELIKSSDLIGGRPRLITADMVGQTIAQLWTRECKPRDWTYTGTEREVAQLRFIQLCLSIGADSAFSTGGY